MSRSAASRGSTWVLCLLSLGACAGPEPAPEPAPPEAIAPPEPAPPEPAPPEPAPPEPAPPEPPAPEATPLPAPDPAPSEPPPRLPDVVMAPPAESPPPPEVTPKGKPAAAPHPAPAATGGPSPLEAAVPDLDDLRQSLVFVDELPPLTLPLEGAPASLLPAGAPAPAQALFARLRDAWLGGEFDAAGDEEVRVELGQQVAGKDAEAVLLSQTLDLASDLRGIDFPDAPWVELAWPDGEELRLELTVYEEDETEDELMTTTHEPEPVPLAAFTPRGAPHEIPLDPITGVEVRLFGPNREIQLEGARATLLLLRAERREAPDAAARQLIAQAFAPLLGAGPADDAAGALALARAAVAAGDDAMRRAARSTDTWVRREVAPLAAEARRLAIVAAAVAQADPSVVRGAQVALGRVIAGLPPGEARRPAAQEPLAKARSLAEPLLEQLAGEELLRGADLAEATEDALHEVSAADEEGSSELGAVAESLGDLQAILRRAARGLELAPALREGRAALEARLRAE